MTGLDIPYWTKHPERLNKDTLLSLRNLVAVYPYFQTLRLLYLKNLYILREADFVDELRKSVLYIHDRRKLFQLLEGERFEIHIDKTVEESENPPSPRPTVSRTVSLIDDFLESMPGDWSKQENIEYVADYYNLSDQTQTNQAQTGQEDNRLKGQDLIDEFINQDNTTPPLRPIGQDTQNTTTPPLIEDNDEGYFTETLAMIYIKQKRYAKALEIIKKLSLKYPKKNAYFADKIRFLEKLIINANSK